MDYCDSLLDTAWHNYDALANNGCLDRKKKDFESWLPQFITIEFTGVDTNYVCENYGDVLEAWARDPHTGKWEGPHGLKAAFDKARSGHGGADLDQLVHDFVTEFRRSQDLVGSSS
ncbi:hypothetical protein ACIQWN_37310 [Streptomyces vinaceus]|uniref:hypothetical protein n=1 Tax=Streptomyces vinaceus TaxID=1960 RepID=UPI0038245EA1